MQASSFGKATWWVHSGFRSNRAGRSGSRANESGVEKDVKNTLAAAEMRDRDLTLQQVGAASERAVATAHTEDPFIRDEQGNPLMVKGTEAPEEAAAKVAKRMTHAG